MLREEKRRIGLANLLANCLRDQRDPGLVTHSLAEMLRFRMLAAACGYEDADDCDGLRFDPLFKLTVGRAPESGQGSAAAPLRGHLLRPRPGREPNQNAQGPTRL